jgi:Tol biopolymer transport system component
MTLPAGSRLGPYEVLSPLGAGGMGEVYRARDTRLGRDVAVKVLPGSRALSAELRERFEREARAVAALSHPHICALFDVGREGSTDYLVMELLEGPTLADRLARGPLPLAEALRFGAGIASALDAAHGKGIVHRDLKPGNVMLTASGVKLVDFGLAKVLEPEGPAEDVSSAPTAAGDVTREGTIVGTLSYMAPEQLEGRAADARTDIFALGSVLYEMSTGRRAFSGASRAALVSAILTSEPPPLTAAQPLHPPALERLVRTCLAKDPARRWQSAHDVALQLESIRDALGEASRPLGADVRSPRRWLPWAVAGLLGAIAAVLAWRGAGDPAVRPPETRFTIPPPEGGSFYMPAEGVQMAVSPDGRRILFVARDASVGTRIFLRDLSDPQPRPVPGTEGGAGIFLSPDGGSLAFFAQGKLKRVDLSGGAAVSICDASRGIGRAGTWGADGRILFASVQGDAIYRVAADGSGRPDPVVKADPEHGTVRVVWPWFLPDGRRFLYMVMHASGERELVLAEEGQPPRSVASMKYRAEYVSPGYLVFGRDGALVAQRFDTAAARLTGEPFPIAPQVSSFLSTGWADFATSTSGTLVYQSHEEVAHLEWFDRSGRSLGSVGMPGPYLGLSISPDGRRAAFARALGLIGTYDVWLLDLERGTETAVTSDPEYSEFGPIWRPDGRSLFYSAMSRSTSAPRIVAKDLASGQESPVLAGGGFQEALDVSWDGRTLAFAEREPGRGFELFTLALAGERRRAKLPYAAVESESLVFSPDGLAVAFTSLESGRSEAYVAPVAPVGERIRVSPDGAESLRWSGDGREIFYATPGGGIVSVPVRTTPKLEVGRPVTLFVISHRFGRAAGPSHAWQGFDVSPDGRRFLAIVPDVVREEQPLTVVVHPTLESRR